MEKEEGKERHRAQADEDFSRLLLDQLDLSCVLFRWHEAKAWLVDLMRLSNGLRYLFDNFRGGVPVLLKSMALL